MTAPAEDPRGGECQQSDWCGPGSHCLCPPAAGRGDTDSSGEEWTAYVVTCQRCAAAARPTGDRAQPTEELREAIRWKLARRIGSSASACADDVLALPAVVALLDAQAAVTRVEAVADELLSDAESAITPGYYRDAADRIRAALDGTT